MRERHHRNDLIEKLARIIECFERTLYEFDTWMILLSLRNIFLRRLDPDRDRRALFGA